MKKQTDPVLIIGGGVIGVCSAYYLAERGREVILLDRGEICSGCSYGNAGLLVPSHSIPLAAPGVMGKGLRWLLDPESPFYIKPRLNRDLLSWLWGFWAASSMKQVRQAIPLLRDLHRASMALYEELAALEGLSFGFTQKGLMYLFNSPPAYEEGLHEARLLAEYGFEFQALTGEEVREREPQVRSSVIGGVLYPEDALLNPADFVTGLARVAEDKGVRIQTNTEVLGFDTAPGKITAVRTTRGDFQPAQVVLASGSWSAPLGKELGLRVPIQPAKGYSITVKRPEAGPTFPLILSEVRVGVTPMGETLRLAGTLELAGLDFSINHRRVEAILKGARSFIGGLDGLEVIEIWRGLRPCTPDGLPILGRSSRVENLILATGHAMIGMCLGPVSGKLVAQLVDHEPPMMDLTALQTERF